MRYEYIKCFWNSSDDDTPVLTFNEVDTEQGRLSVRAAEVFSDRRVARVTGEGVGYEFGAAVPSFER